MTTHAHTYAPGVGVIICDCCLVQRVAGMRECSGCGDFRVVELPPGWHVEVNPYTHVEGYFCAGCPF